MSNNLETLRIIRKNVRQHPWIDVYHKWLIMPWWASILSFIGFFLTGNLLFGTAYWLLGPGAIVNSDGSYLECVFFSVQTLATIGYGFMAPATVAAHSIVAVEAATGVVTMAVMSGLFYGKFSQAKARLRFTQKMLVLTHHGKPTLSFRMANERANSIIDARIRFTLLRPDYSPEGMRMRKFFELPLELSHTPLFSMSLTAMHTIPNGAIDGISVEEMCTQGYEFFVTVVGTDGTFGQTIHATKMYRAHDIVTAGRWEDVVEVLPDGTRIVDFQHFDTILN